MNQQDYQYSQKLGRGMVYIAWILFLGLMTFAFDNFLDRQNNPNQNIPAHIDPNQVPEVTLIQNRDGHYLANGKINNQPVTFLLDTGATDVVIPKHIAQRLKLKQGVATQARTANGLITVYATRLNSVSIGAITLNNIQASINPHMEFDEILLGMSFMKHLDLLQRGKELTLRYPN